MQETKESGFLKVLAFWAEVTCQYDARFILKADDDVYLQVHKVPMLLAQWEALEVGENSNGPFVLTSLLAFQPDKEVGQCVLNAAMAFAAVPFGIRARC